MKKLLVMSVGLCLMALGTPLMAANDVSVTGNLIDTYCYLTMGASGANHAQCAIECAKKGVPVGLLEKGTGKIYVLLPPQNDEPLPDSVISNMEKQVTVTGQKITRGSTTFLLVKSVK